MAVFRLGEFFRRLFRSSSADSSLRADSADPPVATPAPETTDSSVSSPAPLTTTERLSRYVFDRKHVNAERVHFRAFEPPADSVELSVSRTQGLDEEQVWVHGDTWAIGDSGRVIVGRGDFTVRQLAEVRADAHTLVAVPSEPPPRHANVAGWPPPAAKEVRRSLAQQLAATATPVPRSRPPAEAR